MGLFGGVVPQVKANPDTSVNLKTMFLDYLTDWRSFFHSNFNRSGVWVNNWNLTSVYYLNENTRHMLGKYMYCLILAYELTDDAQYLSEAKWLMDLMMEKQTGVGFGYDKTWLLYERLPTSDYAFFHLDAWVWLTQRKLNEYGMGSYNITGQIAEIKGLACFDNATDLAWEYYYWEKSGLSNYLANTFVPMLALMSYFTNQSVSDYTADMNRIYHSIERFRLSDNFYKYKWTDATSETPYSLWIIWHQLLTQLWTSNIVNTTKIQSTLSATTDAKLNEAITEMIGAMVYPIAKNLGYTVPAPFYKAFERAYIYHTPDSLDKQWQRAYQIQSRAREDWFTLSLMVSLGVCAVQNWGVTLTTPALLKSGCNYYFPNVFYNNTYLYSSASYLCMPLWGGGEATQLDAVAGAYLQQPYWDATINAYRANFTQGGTTFYWNISRTTHWFNMTSTNARSWKLIVVDNYFDDYVYKLIMKNGTVLSIGNENKTLVLDSPVFALEKRPTATRCEWYMIKTNNSTITQTVQGASPNVDLILKSTIISYQMYKMVTKYVSLTTSDWVTLESWISDMLENLYNDEWLFQKEYSRSATYGKIIHSDANISNYNDQITSNNKLSFTLTYASGQTSTTYIYVGIKGKPMSIEGATSWSYNDSSKILTVTATHSSWVTIIIKWKFPGDINGDGTVNVTDVSLFSEAYGLTPTNPKWNPNADLNKDNIIDILDLYLLSKNYGKTA